MDQQPNLSVIRGIDCQMVDRAPMCPVLTLERGYRSRLAKVKVICCYNSLLILCWYNLDERGMRVAVA